MIDSTDGPTQFANHQGFEISDSAEFYKLLQAISSIQNRSVDGKAQDGTTAIPTTTFAPSVVGGDSTWSDDTAVHRSSDESVASDEQRDVDDGKLLKL